MSRDKTPPITTFDHFFSLCSARRTPPSTCGLRRIPVFVRAVSAMRAPLPSHRRPHLGSDSAGRFPLLLDVLSRDARSDRGSPSRCTTHSTPHRPRLVGPSATTIHPITPTACPSRFLTTHMDCEYGGEHGGRQAKCGWLTVGESARSSFLTLRGSAR